MITIEQKRTLFDRKEKGIPEAGFVLDWILFLQLMLLGYNERMKSLAYHPEREKYSGLIMS